MAQSPALLARGILTQSSLPELLVYALDRRFQGTLLLQSSNKVKNAIEFYDGAPGKVRLAQADALSFAQVLLELGWVDEASIQSARQRAQSEGKSEEELLISLKSLDATSQAAALREQVRLQTLSLCQLEESTQFGFYDAHLLSNWGRPGHFRVAPLPLVWQALVTHLPAGKRERVLSQWREHVLRLRFQAPVSRYQLAPLELAIVDLLRARPQTVENLYTVGVGSREQVDAVVAALILSRQLEGAGERAPVGAEEPMEVTAPEISPVPPGVQPPGVQPPRVQPPRVQPTPSRAPAPVSSPLPPRASTFSRAVTPPLREPLSSRSLTPASQSAFTPAEPFVASTPPPRSLTPASQSAFTPAEPFVAPAPPSRLPTPSQRRSLSPPARSLTPAPGSTAPEQTAVNPIELRLEIEQKQKHPGANYYQVLGVEPKADAATIRAAFFRLARRWHPDRLPAELDDLRAFVTKMFAKMGEAHHVLLDPARRSEYDAKLKEHPEDEQAQVAEILEAAAAFQRAEVFFKKKDYKNALREARIAYEGDKTQADYIALYAWLESLERSDQDEELPRLIQLLDQAIELDSLSASAYWFRGQLLKRQGKILHAMRDFRSVVEIRPHHVDAQRELRVYEMRKRSDKNKRGGTLTRRSGLFERFTKKN